MVTEKRVLSFKGVASGRLTTLCTSKDHTFKRKWAAQTIVDGWLKKKTTQSWVGRKRRTALGRVRERWWIWSKYIDTCSDTPLHCRLWFRKPQIPLEVWVGFLSSQTKPRYWCKDYSGNGKGRVEIAGQLKHLFSTSCDKHLLDLLLSVRLSWRIKHAFKKHPLSNIG